MERDNEFTHFIAIDFGTCGCGMAFSTNDGPENIRIYANWIQSKMAVKCPTALLLNDEGEFEAFGDTAIRNYESRNRLMRPKKADQYYFFYRFKMCLYEKVCSYNYTVDALLLHWGFDLISNYSSSRGCHYIVFHTIVRHR